MAKEQSIASESTKTLDALFFDRVRRMSASVAYREYDTKRREWRSVSWAGLGLEMTRWRGAMEREEIQPGERIAIMLENCKEWPVIEQAALVLDLIVVPIFPNENPENVAFILRDAAVQLIVIDDLSAWDRLSSIHSFISTVKHVVLLNVREDQEEEVKEQGDSRLVVAKDWLPVEGGPLHERHADTNAIATIVYTTGSTGKPKGVMLSHLNLLTNARAVLSMLAIRHTDVIMTHMNFAHIVERTAAYYVGMMAGAVVAFGRSLENFTHDLLEVNPSILVTESQFLTRMARKLDQELEEHVFIDRMLFRLAVNAGWANFLVEQKQVKFRPVAYLWPMLKGMSANAILPKIIGVRLRRIITTGTPLSPSMAKLFVGLGVNVLQGYHITEASGLVSLNTVMENFTDSIGMSLPGYRIKLTADGQLNVASDGSLAQGYMGHASENDPCFRNDWLQTQDLAEYHDKHLYLNGRMDEELELDAGKRFNPELLEAAIISDVLFDYALVVGEGSYTSAILVLNRSLWNRVTSSIGIETKDANNAEHPKVRELILSRLHAQLHSLPSYPALDSFIISDIPWTVENGMLTPTLRPRRDVIRNRFGASLSLSRTQTTSSAIEAIKEELANNPQIDVNDDDIPTL